MSDIGHTIGAREAVAASGENERIIRRKRRILKAAIFATGLAGIVAEYIMATLASYLLGNAVVQWTMTISIMLFAMGLGSRISKAIRHHLVDAFIVLELALSLLCALSATGIYLLSVYIESIGLVIYLVAISIGVLVGLEIPLATRINSLFEELRLNISSVMEKDYYGALLGGLLFAFVALPMLGLTYTPIILGSVNFAVAAALFLQYRQAVRFPRSLIAGFAVVLVLLTVLALYAKPIVMFSEQKKYRDTIIFEQQTPYQKIVMTRWKDNYWLYLDGHEQFSTYDEALYHEPLVHPAFAVSRRHENILLLGAGDGMAVREILKYPQVKSITLVDIDPAMTELARTHPVLTRFNDNALQDERVRIVNSDAYVFLRDNSDLYDIILIDLPDPRTIALARLYSKEFYTLCVKNLIEGGVLVTQATSPFYSLEAYLSILKTMRAAGIPAVPLHNNIPTMGEWGWVLGMNSRRLDDAGLKQRLIEADYSELDTRFLNDDAVLGMLQFGKGVLERLDSVQVNDEFNLALYRYYQAGSWDIY